MDIDNVLNERGGKYGDFTTEAVMAQTLLDTLKDGESWRVMTSVQRQAMQMFTVKMARIVCGDPNYTDNWLDIEGYAKLARERCHEFDPRQGALNFVADTRPSPEAEPEVRAGWLKDGYPALADRLTAAAKAQMPPIAIPGHFIPGEGFRPLETAPAPDDGVKGRG